MRRPKPFRTPKAPTGAPAPFAVEPSREGMLERPVSRRRKRYPPILEPVCPPTHFTVEEARRAVREVLEEDRLAAEERRRRRTANRGGAERGTAG
jgi:hypothetical protein